MKIHQLPLGARFEYEGREFVKTGPMFGTAKEGGQRLIPKYAQLTVLGDGEPVRDRGPGNLPKAVVLRALEEFYGSCRQFVPEHKHGELEAARDRFLKALG